MPPKVHFGSRGAPFVMTVNKFGEPVKKYINSGQPKPGKFGKSCKGKCCFG